MEIKIICHGKKICQLLNPYASTKYAGEILCQLFGEANRLETVSLRLFNVYGSVSAIEGKVDCPSVVEILLKQKEMIKHLLLLEMVNKKRFG